MSSWRDNDHLVERRIPPSDRMTRFDWIVLILMVLLNAALLAHKVVWG